MTPRKASLRVAHTAKCANASRTALDSLKGCTCKPSYYVSFQTPDGRTRKTPRVKDRRTADQLLRAKQVEIDKGVTGYRDEINASLPEWVDAYEVIVAQRDVKGTTRRAYADTLAVAVEAIGHVRVRDIGPADLRRYYGAIEHTAPATRLKHLRHLSACLTAAVDEGLADKNPVSAFRKSLRLRAGEGTPAYTDAEIARLYGALADAEPVYRYIVRMAVETGARIGELVALDWQDVELLERPRIQIRHTYNPIDGLTTPKDRDARTVHLTPAAQAAIGEWVEICGVKTSGIVFPAPRSGDRVNVDYLRKIINAALEAAGIEKADAETGRPRKPSHSLRATYARRMLEAGKHPQWVEAQMGHSDLKLTIAVYGRWSEDAMHGEAQRQ